MKPNRSKLPHQIYNYLHPPNHPSDLF
uniref:Uncharacterized protein n=1 Tax=Arundo donax TaxID=35708 RepID=A0A0A9GWT8_ARUDO